MGVDSMNSMGFDADEARYDRMNRTQPAQFAPGQNDTMDIFSGSVDDIFSNSTIPNNQTAMGDVFSNNAMGFGAGGFSPVASPNSMGGNVQQQERPKDAADKFWDAMGKGSKSTWNFFKEVSTAFGQVTKLWWYKYTFKVCVISGIVSGLGIVFKLFGVSGGLSLTVGGLISLAFGVSSMCMLSDASKTCTSLYKEDNTAPEEPPIDFTGGDMGFSEPQIGMDDFLESGVEDDFSDFSDDEDDDWGDDDWGSSDTSFQASEGMNTEDALSSLPDIPKGMYERRYLYDMFIKVMPTMRPDFANLREIDEDSDTFLLWNDRLLEAAQCSGCKEDYLPELTMLQENLFVVIVSCTRPQGCKPDSIGLELANIYAYDVDTGEKNEGVFAKVDTIGSNIKITLFNGTSSMISLKDMILRESDFMLDSKNYIPVILGVNQLGNVIKVDFKKLESVIITGMPRSGKSWFVQAILTQMCVFVPPYELHLYICDPKDGISDFKGFCLPHVKKFVSGDANIVNTIRELVKREAPRRKKIIGDAGFVNIWDYKERYPDVKIPIIYVVVDEVVTLASRMDKETFTDFKMLLRELISQLPALGIRAFLVPHILNNEIIEKKTSDLVPCKISVKGDADHIEKATGSKFKDFPYKLSNVGDMAVKLANMPNTMFVHGPALTESNPKNNDLFDYLRRVWGRLEPEEVEGSVAESADLAKDLERISSDESILSGDDEFNLF